MDRDEIEAALREVSDDLHRRGVVARVCIVGGAAMVLAFDSRFSTADVDADFSPTEEVVAAVAKVASSRGLPAQWLNDSAKIFIPSFKNPDWRPVFKVGNVEILTADERTMLAMKMRASRGSRDIEDIRLLLAKCHIQDEGQAHALYNEFFPEDPLPTRAGPLLRRALEP
jgi:Nucleotidyltransferase of unknown function (DUF6036)